jgi:hypothetical protein
MTALQMKRIYSLSHLKRIADKKIECSGMSAEPAGGAENKFCLSPDHIGTGLFILMQRNSIFRPAFGGITFLEFIPSYAIK